MGAEHNHGVGRIETNQRSGAPDVTPERLAGAAHSAWLERRLLQRIPAVDAEPGPNCLAAASDGTAAQPAPADHREWEQDADEDEHKPVQLGLINNKLLRTGTAVLKRFAKRARRATEIKAAANGDTPAAPMR